MTKIVHKPYIDYEKEEIWLNKMADEGWDLKRYTWCRYEFEKGEPGKYIYRLEQLENAVNHPDSQAYLRFLEESGIQHVTSYMRWIYVRRPASEGPFEVYTDTASRIKHYYRIMRIMAPICGINLYLGIVNTAMLHSSQSHLSWWSQNVSLLNLAAAGLLLPYCVRLFKRINALKKEEPFQG